MRYNNRETQLHPIYIYIYMLNIKHLLNRIVYVFGREIMENKRCGCMCFRVASDTFSLNNYNIPTSVANIMIRNRAIGKAVCSEQYTKCSNICRQIGNKTRFVYCELNV